MKKYITTEELYSLFINCNQKISTDTRKVEHGSIFFALKGDNFNANTFAQSAIDGGCRYAIVDDENISNGTTILLVNNVLAVLQDLAKYHRKQLKFPIIGITGSNGKTTNKELIHAVLSKKYKTYATKGNLNNHIGVPLTLLSLTTFHEMAIVEMGANHQGEIAMLSELSDPDYGVITNIGKAHLEGFGGEEGVKKGKSELYKHLKFKNGTIFINENDTVLKELSEGLSKIYYGDKPECDVFGAMVSNSEFVEFKWNTKGQSLDTQPLVKTHMFGHYNFVNVLCAVCIGNYFGVGEEAINEALEQYVPEMNRSQIKKTDSNTVILDAYNANPSSMDLAIKNFAEQPLKNKVLILGDMFELGDYSEKEHEQIIKQLLETNLDEVYLVGKEFGLFQTKVSKFQFFETGQDLKLFLNNHPIFNATILIKGSRGMKLEQVVDCL